jgi:hypothetical protein
VASLAKGNSATLSFVYHLSSTAADVVNTASVTSATTERNSLDNSSSTAVVVTSTGGGGGGCNITCPSNITVSAAAGQSTANVTYTTPTAAGCGTITCDPPSGSDFPVGTTQVTCTGTGDTCSFTVTVTGTVTITLNSPPGTCHDESGAVVPCSPSPLTAECHTSFTDPGATAKNAAGQTISYTTQVVCTVPDPNDPNQDITVPCSFDVNKPGVYTFIYTATDSGQTATAARTVYVVDTTPPVITLNGANPMTVQCGSTFTDPGATANDTCAGSFAAIPSGTVNTGVVGTYTITYFASDSSGNNATPVTRTVNVVDTVAPVVTAPPNLTMYTGPGATSCGLVISDATLGSASAADACDGSRPVTRTGVPSGNFFPVGTTTVTYTATDTHGNTGSAAQTVTVIDNTPPVITCPANVTVYLPLNTTATSMAVSYPSPTMATDNCTSSPTIAYSPASGSVFNVGTTTVTVTATDAAGNQSTCTFTVTVLYDFTGFFSPVGNPPTLNVVNAGRAVPVKFSLSGNKGLNIFAAGYPQSGAIPCDASAPAVDLTETVTAGSSSLSYDAASDQYVYVWATDQSWAGTCRQLIVKLNDGSTHVANFKFR